VSSAPNLPYEYVTGLILMPPVEAFSSEARIHVHNVSESVETTRTFGFASGQQSSNLLFDSDVNFSPELGPFTGDVPPTAVWTYRRTIYQEDRVWLWLRIMASSLNLVPSVEFYRDDSQPGGIPQRQTILRYEPGDFAVFHRGVRFTPGEPAPTPPGEIG
jgi:hypothetical protein